MDCCRSVVLLALVGCNCFCLRTGIAESVPLTGQVRTVYWNSSSPVFEQSQRRGGFLVQKNDRLVVACPTNSREFYKIYWTHSSSAARDCHVDASQVFFLLECRRPTDFGIYQVTDFSPIPGAPTFDRPVFLFTPSSGQLSGIDQMSGGACESRRLRLMVDIGDPDTPVPQDAWNAQPSPPSVVQQPADLPGDPLSQPPHQPRPSARQTPPAAAEPGGGYQDVAKLDSQSLNLITGAAGSLPSPRLVLAGVAFSSLLMAAAGDLFSSGFIWHLLTS